MGSLNPELGHRKLGFMTAETGARADRFNPRPSKDPKKDPQTSESEY